MFRPLPGQCVTLDTPTMCEEHPRVKATRSLCVEADSFGEEYRAMCDECWDDHLKGLELHKLDPDSWECCPKCGSKSSRMVSYRDIDEGSSGPVYEHCPACHLKYQTAIAREYDDEMEDVEDYDNYEPCDREPQSEYLNDADYSAAITYFKMVLGLDFVRGNGGKSEILLAEVHGNYKFKKVKRKLEKFKDAHVSDTWLLGELFNALQRGCDEVYIKIIDKRTNPITKPYVNKTLPVMLEEMRKASGTQVKSNPRKGHVTPEYQISIALERIFN